MTTSHDEHHDPAAPASPREIAPVPTPDELDAALGELSDLAGRLEDRGLVLFFWPREDRELELRPGLKVRYLGAGDDIRDQGKALLVAAESLRCVVDRLDAALPPELIIDDADEPADAPAPGG